MTRRRHTPEQIVRKLREADRLLGEGAEVPEVAKALTENARLKRIMAGDARVHRRGVPGRVLCPARAASAAPRSSAAPTAEA
jgi:hypothetical protein